MDQFVERYIHHPKMSQMFDWVKSEGGNFTEYRYFKQVRNNVHSFFAIKQSQLDKFIAAYVEWKNQNQPLHIHELVTNKATCKMYIDVEQKNVLEYNEKLLPKFISDLTNFIGSSRYMVFKGSRILNKGQRPYEYKWSYHLILTDLEYDDNFDVMSYFVTSFYKNFPKYDHFKDLDVYSKNRNMRMLWSSKDDGHRLEFDYNLSSEIYKGYTDERILRNSLIVRNSDYEKPTRQTTTKTLKRKRNNSEVDIGGQCDEFVKKYLSDHEGSITKCTLINDNNLKIETTCRYCLTKKDRISNDPYHKNNNIYLMIHYLPGDEYEIRQGCYDSECHLHAKENLITSLPLVYASYADHG